MIAVKTRIRSFDLHAAVILVSVSSTLILVWFRKGLMMGWAEGGLPFYAPWRLYSVSSHAWADSQLGTLTPSVVSSAPFYYVLGILTSAGIQPVILQALTFWLLLNISGFSMYLLSKNIDGSSTSTATIAALVYMVNPIGMTIVWHKFLLQFIIAYSTLPLALYLFAQGLLHKKLMYAVYFGVATVLFSYGLANPLYVSVLWLAILILVIAFILSLHHQETRPYCIKYLGLSSMMWFFFNCWWILQLVYGGEHQFRQGFSSTPRGDLSTLNFISYQYHGTIYFLVRMLYWFYLMNPDQVSWSPIYSSAVFQGLGTLYAGVIVASLFYKSRGRRMMYFPLLFVIVLFLSKGTSPPFGDVFAQLFVRFWPLRIFRNPIESFGLLLPLAASPMLARGTILTLENVARISEKSSCLGRLFTKVSKGLLLVFLVLILIVYPWPMWTGSVFSTSQYTPTNKPEIGYNVVVPAYYEQANSFFSKSSSNYRAFVLPMNPGGITYNWAFGFNGQGLSDELYPIPVVSESVTWSLYGTSTLTAGLEPLLFSRPDSFWKVMAMMNTKYLVVRNDVNYTDRSMTSPETITHALVAAQPPSIANGMVEEKLATTKRIVVSVENVEAAWADLDKVNFKNKVNGRRDAAYSFATDALNTRQANNSLAFSAFPIDGNLGFLIFPEHRDFSNYEYLEVWLKASSNASLFVELDDSFDQGLTWDGRLNGAYYLVADQWTLFVLPIKIPTETLRVKTSFDTTHVRKLLVGITGADSGALTTLRIGGLFLDTGGPPRKAFGINYSRTFGELDVYELEEHHSLPRVFAVGNCIETSNLRSMLLGVLAESTYDPRSTIVLIDGQQSIETKIPCAATMRRPPYISFLRLSPSEYRVEVRSTEAFYLVLSDVFSPGWTGYYGTRDPLTVPFADPKSLLHFEANGFANGWYVERSGNFTITLLFRGQTSLDYGTLITAGALFVCFSLVLYQKSRVIRAARNHEDTHG